MKWNDSFTKLYFLLFLDEESLIHMRQTCKLWNEIYHNRESICKKEMNKIMKSKSLSKFEFWYNETPFCERRKITKAFFKWDFLKGLKWILQEDEPKVEIHSEYYNYWLKKCCQHDSVEIASYIFSKRRAFLKFDYWFLHEAFNSNSYPMFCFLLGQGISFSKEEIRNCIQKSILHQKPIYLQALWERSSNLCHFTFWLPLQIDYAASLPSDQLLKTILHKGNQSPFIKPAFEQYTSLQNHPMREQLSKTKSFSQFSFGLLEKEQNACILEYKKELSFVEQTYFEKTLSLIHEATKQIEPNCSIPFSYFSFIEGINYQFCENANRWLQIYFFNEEQTGISFEYEKGGYQVNIFYSFKKPTSISKFQNAYEENLFALYHYCKQQIKKNQFNIHFSNYKTLPLNLWFYFEHETRQCLKEDGFDLIKTSHGFQLKKIECKE